MNETSGKPGICIVTFEYPPFRGGIASYAFNLALEASSFREVAVLAPGDAQVGEDGFAVLPLLEHHRLRPRVLMRALMAIGRMKRDTIVHAADIRAGFIAFCAKLLFGRRYIVMTHGSDVAKFDRFSLSKLAAMAIYGMASRVVSNSDYTKKVYEKNFPHGASCRSIPLGVGAEWFSEPGPCFDSNALASLPADAEIFCTVGRLDPRKGHLVALEAIAEYQRLNPRKKAIYVIGGMTIDTDYRARIEREVERLKVDARLVGVVSLDDLKRLYRRAKVQLLCARPLPGKIEGFGLVLLEAAAQGCPSIATRVGGIPEVLLDGETGIIVDAATPSEVAMAISKLILKMEGSDGVSRRCMDHARSFSWAVTARTTYTD